MTKHANLITSCPNSHRSDTDEGIQCVSWRDGWWLELDVMICFQLSSFFLGKARDVERPNQAGAADDTAMMPCRHVSARDMTRESDVRNPGEQQANNTNKSNGAIGGLRLQRIPDRLQS